MFIAYRLALRDVVFFQNYQFDHSPESVRTRRLATWGGAAIIVALLGVMAIITQSWPLFLMGVVLAGVYVFVFPQLLRANIRRMTNRMYAGQLNVLGRRELEITDEGLVARTEEEESVVPWETIDDVTVLDRYLFIYLGARAAHIVPRDTVMDGGFVEFTGALRRRLGARRRASPADPPVIS